MLTFIVICVLIFADSPAAALILGVWLMVMLNWNLF
jgi:hypothetical protein